MPLGGWAVQDGVSVEAQHRFRSGALGAVPRPAELTVGQVAERSDVAISALHFCERAGLITSSRTTGNQRRYARSAVRRIAFSRASRCVGNSHARIRTALEKLPADRPPSAADWERLSQGWLVDLEPRIVQLQVLRDDLTACIGCDCLSVQTCHLANPGDVLGARAPGPSAAGHERSGVVRATGAGAFLPAPGVVRGSAGSGRAASWSAVRCWGDGGARAPGRDPVGARYLWRGAESTP